MAVGLQVHESWAGLREKLQVQMAPMNLPDFPHPDLLLYLTDQVSQPVAVHSEAHLPGPKPTTRILPTCHHPNVPLVLHPTSLTRWTSYLFFLDLAQWVSPTLHIHAFPNQPALSQVPNHMPQPSLATHCLFHNLLLIICQHSSYLLQYTGPLCTIPNIPTKLYHPHPSPSSVSFPDMSYPQIHPTLYIQIRFYIQYPSLVCHPLVLPSQISRPQRGPSLPSSKQQPSLCHIQHFHLAISDFMLQAWTRRHILYNNVVPLSTWHNSIQAISTL